MGATLHLVAASRRIVEHGGTDDVAHGLDCATALGLAEARDVLLEGDYQVLGVHAAPIVAVYGANDMAPWGHMYVNPGLTEPFFMPLPAETIVYLSNSCLTALPGHERFTPPRQAVRG